MREIGQYGENPTNKDLRPIATSPCHVITSECRRQDLNLHSLDGN
jgi:hypothetical protein